MSGSIGEEKADRDAAEQLAAEEEALYFAAPGLLRLLKVAVANTLENWSLALPGSSLHTLPDWVPEAEALIAATERAR